MSGQPFDLSATQRLHDAAFHIHGETIDRHLLFARGSINASMVNDELVKPLHVFEIGKKLFS